MVNKESCQVETVIEQGQRKKAHRHCRNKNAYYSIFSCIMFQRRDFEISLECLLFYHEKSRILWCIKIHGCGCYCFGTHKDFSIVLSKFNSVPKKQVYFFSFFLQEALQLYYYHFFNDKVIENNTVHRINPTRLQHIFYGKN